MKLMKKVAVKLSDHTPTKYLLNALCIDWLVYCFINSANKQKSTCRICSKK